MLISKAHKITTVKVNKKNKIGLPSKSSSKYVLGYVFFTFLILKISVV